MQLDWWWWLIIGILWLAIGYFVAEHLLTLTLGHIDRKRTPRPELPMTTAEKGGFAVMMFVLIVIWPIVLTACAVYWFFWSLFWLIGKGVERLPGWRDC